MGRKCCNLVGEKFGKLTVISISDIRCNRGIKWWCECECGNVITVSSSNLKSENTKSCGCSKITLII